MIRALIFAAAIAASAAVASAQTIDNPRAVAERVAQAVEENFYDAARAHDIAAEVRREASAGHYDITDPGQLASAFTATLHPHDGHFRVEWAPVGVAVTQSATPTAPPEGAEARANYGIPSAMMLPGGVGVIDIRLFSDFTPDDVATSAAKRTADAAMTMVSGAQAIIFDLRDCAGGSPAMVGYLAGHFEPAGANIYNVFHGRGGESSEAPFAEPATGRRLNTPLFILTSGRTGSACESFAYTLQSAHRAVIVGAATAGGANPGGYIPLGQGLSVFVSGASPINPITGRNWEGTGVQPDVAVPADQALTRARELALQAALRAPANQSAATDARWALDALHAEANPYPRNLDQYVGTYGPRSVAIDGGRLALHRDRRPPLTLLPIETDLFAISGAAPLQRVRFERDSGGRVIAVTLSSLSGQQSHDLRTR